MIEVWLDNGRGERLRAVERVTYVSYIKTVNGTGAFEMGLPADEYLQPLWTADNLVEIWRDGQLEMVGLIRRILFEEGATQVMRVYGPDQHELLERRIVAYAAGSAQAQKSGKADDLMKAVVRENLGSLAISGRNLTSLGMNVTADTGQGPLIEKGFAWQPMMEVLKELADAAATAGTATYFWLAPGFDAGTGTVTFSFQTAVKQPGTDHSATSSVPLTLGRSWGNMGDIQMEFDWTPWYSRVYAGGQGEGADRYIYEEWREHWETYSPWGRKEFFVDARDQETQAGVQARARAALWVARPKVRFSGKVLQANGSFYNVDWRLGDLINAQHRGYVFDALIRSVKVTQTESAEQIEAKFEIS